jgi:hypothetical protein
MLRTRSRIVRLPIEGQECEMRLLHVPTNHTLLFEGGRRHEIGQDCYIGQVRNDSSSRVMLCRIGRNLYGSIMVANEMYHLERWKGKTTIHNDTHVLLYRQQDLIWIPDSPEAEPLRAKSLVPKMSALVDTSKRTTNSTVDSDRKYHVCDLSFTIDAYHAALLDNDIERIANEMNLILMMLNYIYEAQRFGGAWITFRLSKVNVIWTNSSEPMDVALLCEFDTIDSLLTVYNSIDNDDCVSMLITSRTLDHVKGKRALGLAYFRSDPWAYVCRPGKHLFGAQSQKYNVGVATSKLASNTLNRIELASVVAHEIGHLFGAPHSDEHKDRSCHDGYLMSSTGGKVQSHKSLTFSQCSIKTIADLLSSFIDCLQPLQSICGNGRREAAEQCDCGDSKSCALLDNCCDPNTCRFQPNCLRRQG